MNSAGMLDIVADIFCRSVSTGRADSVRKEFRCIIGAVVVVAAAVDTLRASLLQK